MKETTRYMNFNKTLGNPIKVISPRPERATTLKPKFNITSLLQAVPDLGPPPFVNKSKNSAFKPLVTSKLDVQPQEAIEVSMIQTKLPFRKQIVIKDDDIVVFNQDKKDDILTI
jgi:hypothetical protein